MFSNMTDDAVERLSEACGYAGLGGICGGMSGGVTSLVLLNPSALWFFASVVGAGVVSFCVMVRALEELARRSPPQGLVRAG